MQVNTVIRWANARSALWSGGFRPFFLAAGAFAAVAVPLWVLALDSGLAIVGAGDPLHWHIHEMIFGYVGAVVAGFLMTAIPNWTGRLPVRGRPLMLLVLLWAAGRVAIFAAGFLGVIAAVIDAAFLIVLAGVAWREVISGRNLRNVPICVMVSLFALTNLAFHADPMMPGAADYAIRGALGLILLLISLIGGRIVPSFTRNWLAKAGATAMPAPFGDFDKLSLFVTALAALAWTFAPESGTTAGLFAAAAALQAIRLTRWQGLAARREPLLLVLHVAYAWLPVAMALLAAGVVWPEIGTSPGIHAFTAGGIGMMTLAVMTRATLGHTGRALTAGTGTNAIYLLVFAGAVIRVAAFWLPVDYVAVITLAGALWSAGFLLFVWVYGPMLVGPSARRG